MTRRFLSFCDNDPKSAWDTFVDGDAHTVFMRSWNVLRGSILVLNPTTRALPVFKREGLPKQMQLVFEKVKLGVG